MPCSDFINAYNLKKIHPGQYGLTIFFTKHYGGTLDDPQDFNSHRDKVIYASGPLNVVDGTYGINKKHLRAQNLIVSKNTDTPGQMISDSTITYDVDIYPDDGTISYRLKTNGNPVGPAITVNVTCVNGVILTGTDGSDVVAVGVQNKML